MLAITSLAHQELPGPGPRDISPLIAGLLNLPDDYFAPANSTVLQFDRKYVAVVFADMNHDSLRDDRLTGLAVMLRSLCATLESTFHAFVFCPEDLKHRRLRDRRFLAGALASVKGGAKGDFDCLASVEFRYFSLDWVEARVAALYSPRRDFLRPCPADALAPPLADACCGRCQLAQFAKLWVPFWLPRGVETVLLADADLFAVASLAPLWEPRLLEALRGVEGGGGSVSGGGGGGGGSNGSGALLAGIASSGVGGDGALLATHERPGGGPRGITSALCLVHCAHARAFLDPDNAPALALTQAALRSWPETLYSDQVRHTGPNTCACSCNRGRA